jgi:mRNA interferase RelE/StbE
MAYEIELVDSAVEDFRSLEARDQSTIKSALETHLRHEPTKESRSRIKRLRGLKQPQYRLRVDDFRVFYDVGAQTVTVLAIVLKSKAEEWLNKHSALSDD